MSTVDQIMESITDAIIERRWLPKQKIPTEQELAHMFGASRNSVREAVKALVTLGILEIRRPDGTFVADKFSDRMLNPLLYSLVLTDDYSESLFELRCVMEDACRSMVVEKGSEEDFARIRQALEELFSVLENENSMPEEIVDADIAFHNVISQATHNELFYRFSYVISMLSRPYRIKTTIAIFRSGRAEKESLLEELHKVHTMEYEVLYNRERHRLDELAESSQKYWKYAMDNASNI